MTAATASKIHVLLAALRLFFKEPALLLTFLDSTRCTFKIFSPRVR